MCTSIFSFASKKSQHLSMISEHRMSVRPDGLRHPAEYSYSVFRGTEASRCCLQLIRYTSLFGGEGSIQAYDGIHCWECWSLFRARRSRRYQTICNVVRQAVDGLPEVEILSHNHQFMMAPISHKATDRNCGVSNCRWIVQSNMHVHIVSKVAHRLLWSWLPSCN